MHATVHAASASDVKARIRLDACIYMRVLINKIIVIVLVWGEY